MRDAWRAYLELALGLTEASRKKAEQTARSLVGKGGATAAQLQTVAEDLLSAGSANRESLTRLVRVEVDRALGAVGLAKADEVAALHERVRRLEGDLEQARTRAAAASAAAVVAESAVAAEQPSNAMSQASAGSPASAGDRPAETAVAKKAVAKKAVAKKAVASKDVAERTVAKKAVAKKAVAKKALAKKAVAKKAVAGDDATTKASAKKLGPGADPSAFGDPLAGA